MVVSYKKSSLSLLVAFAIFTIGCSAQTEQQAMESLRQLTRDGKLPAESVVEQIERRFAGRQAGVLARLLRARIKFENKDYSGAASLLASPDLVSKTKLGDYALWLRGQAQQLSGDHPAAIDTYAKLERDFPHSIRHLDSKLRHAESLIAAGRHSQVPAFLAEMAASRNANALLLTAKAYEAGDEQANAIKFYREVYFLGAGSPAAKEAEAKLASLAQPLTPLNSTEAASRAETLLSSKSFVEADKAFALLSTDYASSLTTSTNLRRLQAAIGAKAFPNAQAAFIAIPDSAAEKEQAFYESVTGHAAARMWPQARKYAEEMRQKFPNGKLTPKAWVDAGYAARDAKYKGEENYFLRTALTAWPGAVEVAGAQFELAWLEHETRNYSRASEMLIEHLARYADRDTTNRGRAGYWAARNAERAGRPAEACTLYEALNYRYNANWYGYLGLQRIAAMRNQGQCKEPSNFPVDSQIAKAAANLKKVTVAAETSGPKEIERAEKSDQLSIVGLFDWAIDELNEARKTAQNSPKINLALARYYRLKGDNVNALLALAKSYPDYAQMFPEEMGREEWDVFYPLNHWNEIKYWAGERKLDPYQVAGLIRQESVFNPRARSGANAYGLMQLLVPTAQTMARKYVARTSSVTASSLFEPPLNIELGTAYMRDQLDRFGLIEYMAVAYNAGPGRVAPWRATLPIDIDEFVEAIPFKETKGYVQGVIRNSAQYRRLYDENGSFKPNVGTRPLRGEIDTKAIDEFNAQFPEVVVERAVGE